MPWDPFIDGGAKPDTPETAAPAWDPFRDSGAVAVEDGPPAPPEIKAVRPPGFGEHAYQVIREAISPLLGETPEQTMRRKQMQEQLRSIAPELVAHIEGLPSTAANEQQQAEGAIGTVPRILFTPPEGAPQLPLAGQQEGTVAQIGAGLYNTAAGVANSMVSPGGALVGMGGMPARVVAAAMTPALAHTAATQLPETILTALDENISAQDKTEAIANETLAAVGAVGGARVGVQSLAGRVAEARYAQLKATAALDAAVQSEAAAAADAAKPPVKLTTTAGTTEVPAADVPGALRAALEPAATPEPVTQGSKPLGLVESAKESPATQPALREKLAGFYEPITNRDTLAAANAKIDAAGSLDRAKSDFLTTAANSADPVTSAVGLELYKKFNVEGKLEDAADVIYSLAQRAKTQGQAIQVLATLSRGTPEGMASFITKTLGRKLTPEELQQVNDGMRRVNGTKDPEVKLARHAELIDSLVQGAEATPGQKAAAIVNLTLLLNPKTIIRNIGGNGLMAGLDLTADTVAPAVDWGVSLFTGKRTVSGPAIGEYMRGLGAPVQDVMKGYQQARSEGANPVVSLKEGLNTMVTMSRLMNSGRLETADVTQAYRSVFSNRLARMAETTMTTVLSAPDRAFATARFRSSLASQMKAEGALAPTADMLARAAYERSAAVFQQENAISNAGKDIKNALNFRQKFGVGNAVLPFTQTPGGVLSRAIEYSPAGFISAGYEAFKPVFFKDKGFDQHAFTNAFTRALTGTAALVPLGYMLGRTGVVTGAPDENEAINTLKRQMGVTSYSLNASEMKRRLISGDWESPFFGPEKGDVLVTYDWAQPAAFPVAVGADMALSEARSAADAKNPRRVIKDTGEVLSALMSGTKTLAAQPMLMGLSGFMRKDNPVDAMAASITRLPQLFMPRMVSQAQQILDNRVYEVRGSTAFETLYQGMASQIPGLAEKLGYPARTDMLGEVSQRYQANGNTLFNVLVNPAFVNHVTNDARLNELYRLWQATGRTEMIPPQAQPTITIREDGRAVQKVLTSTELANYQQMVGRLNSQMLTGLMRNDAYAAMPDALRAQVLAKMLSPIDNAARIVLFGDRPDKIDEMTAALVLGITLRPR